MVFRFILIFIEGYLNKTEKRISVPDHELSINNWIQLDSIGFNWIQLDSIGFNMIQLGSIGFNWIQLDSIGFNPFVIIRIYILSGDL